MPSKSLVAAQKWSSSFSKVWFIEQLEKLSSYNLICLQLFTNKLLCLRAGALLQLPVDCLQNVWSRQGSFASIFPGKGHKFHKPWKTTQQHKGIIMIKRNCKIIKTAF